jgi:mycothiol synthase
VNPASGDVVVSDLPPIPGLVIRPGSGDEDWGRMADVLNRARLADGIEESTTPAGLAADWGVRDGFTLEDNVLFAEIHGEPVGVAVGHLLPRGGTLALECWGSLVPEWRRRRIGTTMHRTTRTRLVGMAAADPRPGPREFRSYAMDVETGDRALLDAEGYVQIRFGFEMRRWLTGELPVHPLPPGLETRPVLPADHRTIFEADDEAFQDHWGHRPATEGDFRSVFEHPDTNTSLWCVAWDGDEVAGVVQNAIYHDENERFGVKRGWLEHVSVRRPWRGRGLAKALCAASFQVLRDAGMQEAWLGVDAANPTGALRLYEDLGFAVVRQWTAYGRPIEGPAPAGWQSAEDTGSVSEA